jgi:hypothetical protein
VAKKEKLLMNDVVVDAQSSIVRMAGAEAGLSLSLSLRCPRSEFDGETVGGGAPTNVAGDLTAGQQLTAQYVPIALAAGGSLEVTLHLQQSPEDGLLRKWACYRLNGVTSVLLKEVVLEDIDTTNGEVTLDSWQPVFTEPMSYPVFFKGFFAGIEFPTASTRIADGHAVIGHRPGIRLQPGQEYETRKAIFGAALQGRERRDFQNYIIANSPGGIQRFFVWEPWISIPIVFTEQHNLDYINRIYERFWKPYGVAADTCIMTAGWSDPKDLYKVDQARFPQGLGKVRAAVESIGSKLGTWVSPSSCYGFAVDPATRMAQGYEYNRETSWACMAGKRYQAKFKERITDLFAQNEMVYAYFDGFMQQCPETDHGHEPGPLSAEAIASGLIDVIAAIRKVNPKAWLEATCFGGNAGPWWLFHFNTVLGNYGEDYCWGRVPCPNNQESGITCRDYNNLQGLVHGLLPAALQEVFGGFLNHTHELVVNDMVMGAMRGNMLYMIGTDPKVLSDYALAAFARIIEWSRANTAFFANTQALLQPAWDNGNCPVFSKSVPAVREPYGYAHWQGDRGIVALRNPWIIPQQYSLRLDEETDLPTDAANLSAVSLYPENRIYATGLKYGDTLTISLAPYETVVLALEPGAPVMQLPQATEQIGHHVQVAAAASKVTRIEWPADDELLGTDWIKPVGGVKASLQVELDAKVVLSAPQGELLVLIEDVTMPAEPRCTITVNGKATAWALSTPDQAYVATDIDAPERWAFLRVPLAPGESRLHIDLLTRSEAPTVSAWTWAYKEGVLSGSLYPNSLPQPEILSLDSAQFLAPVGISDASLATEHRARAIEKINGVYLDCLEPAAGSGAASNNVTPSGSTPLKSHGWHFLRGINVEAPNRLIYTLDGKYSRFQASAGLESSVVTCDRCGAKAELAFKVLVDGQERWNSGDRNYFQDPVPVDVDVTGAQTLALVVEDHSLMVEAAPWLNWGEARLIR